MKRDLNLNFLSLKIWKRLLSIQGPRVRVCQKLESRLSLKRQSRITNKISIKKDVNWEKYRPKFQLRINWVYN